MKKKETKDTADISYNDYDGYYDDRVPDDDGTVESELDRSVIRKVVAVLTGTILIAIISIFIMKYL